MKRRTQEWIEKAEGDWKIAEREMQATDPVWDGVCFLAQQCAEKYLKAFLEEHNIVFQKIHDLVALLDLSGGSLPELDPLLLNSEQALGALYYGQTISCCVTWWYKPGGVSKRPTFLRTRH